jgi:RNA polymerase sigma-70 factor, ECF subfamily
VSHRRTLGRDFRDDFVTVVGGTIRADVIGMTLSMFPDLASDEELVRRIARGDRASLGQLYARHAGSLERYARTWCRPDDASDVVHDTFVALVARAEQFDARRGEVSAWLHRCVKHRAIDGARSASRRRVLLRERADGSGLHDGGVEQATLVRELFEGASISARTEVTLLQVLAGELTCAEAAAREGVPVGTVKSRFRRGLHALRDVAQRDRAA